MSREAIFERIRRRLAPGESDAVRRRRVAHRIAAHAPNQVPARGRVTGEARVDRFIRMAREAAAEVIELATWRELPGAVDDWLRIHGIARLVMASDPPLCELAWPRGAVAIEQRRARAGDPASLTTALAGIAETGSLLLYSRRESPTTLNFLPDDHLVVLPREAIVGSYEEGWRRLRRAAGDRLPRTVNLITGPSRSADIEQQLQLGAHGPCRLVIFLVGENSGGGLL